MNSTAIPASTSAIRILRLPEVCKVTGLGRAMIYRLQAVRRFPQSVKITEFAVGWVDSEVQAWLVERVAACRRRAPPGEQADALQCD
jgi:prophage regulatory protein